MMNIVVILFAWLQFIPITNAFSTGAGGCPGGIAAVGGLHLSTDSDRPVDSNTLINAGISVTINQTTLVDDDNTIVTEYPSNENLIISIFGTQIPYLGFLIRVQLPDNEVGADLIQPYNDDMTSQIAEACASPAQGITHRNNSAKLLTSGLIYFDKPYTNITIDITVVFTNGLPASIFAYSGYSINIVGPAVSTNPTITPSASAVTTTSPSSTPTNIPTATEVTSSPTTAPSTSPITKETSPPTNVPTATEISNSPTSPPLNLPSYSPSTVVTTSAPSSETDKVTVKPTQIRDLVEPTSNPTSSSIQPTETAEFLPPTSMPTMITPSTMSDIPTVLTEPPFASIRRPSVITETPFASVRKPNTNPKPSSSVSKPSATIPNKGKKSNRHDKKKKNNDQKGDNRLDIEEKDSKDHDGSNNNDDVKTKKNHNSKSTKAPKVTKFYTNKKTKVDDSEQLKGAKMVEIRSKLSRIDDDSTRRLATRRRMR